MNNDHELLTDRSATLTWALARVAADAGHAIDADDLHAALGLSLFACAVAGESRIDWWSMYARDRFVVPAARLFGMRLRDLHPPDVARGLDTAAEFEQHFDLSYRPLIHRAMEHGQAVLAWRGWRGEEGPTWGIIREISKEGVGFAGSIPQTGRVDASKLTVLDRPASQVYVVETIERTTPTNEAIVSMAMEHAREGFDRASAGRWGIATGAAAIELFEERLARDASKELLNQASAFVESMGTGSASAVRLIDRHKNGATSIAAKQLDGLCESCEVIIRSWTSWRDALLTEQWHTNTHSSSCAAIKAAWAKVESDIQSGVALV